MKIFVVIEDKENEQAAALAAIRKVLLITEEPESQYREKTDSGILGYTDAKVMVLFAATLAWWKSCRLGFITQMAKSAQVMVLTDLMFPEKAGGQEAPWGLEVLTDCATHGLPVVVCSDTDHHNVGWLMSTLSVIGKAHPRGEIPVILDKKDWVRAVQEALRLLGD